MYDISVESLGDVFFYGLDVLRGDRTLAQGILEVLLKVRF